MKKIFALIVFLFAFNFSYGQTTLAAGEIAITGFNSDNPDQFTFVLLTDVTATTEIKFTDRGWIAAGGFRPLEGTLTWTATSNLACGTEITIANDDPFSTTIGSVSNDPSFNFSDAGDQLLAYQGNIATPTFIYAITFNSTGWSDATSANTTALPTGLTDTVNAVNFGETDSANYNCTVTTDQSLILPAISTATNWTLSNTPLTLGGCSYTCTPCLTTVTWDGANWSNPPGLTTAAIINGPYITGANGAFSACRLIINSGFKLTIENGDFVEIENDVLVNGELFIETQGAFVQRGDGLAADTFTGIATVNKTTALKQAWYYYSYWSSPVAGETIDTAFPDAPLDRRFWYDANSYLDTAPPDGIDDNGDDWKIANGVDPVIPGVGYAVTSALFGPPFPRIDIVPFNGALNTGDIPSTIFYDAANTEHWNLIGNPYPSAIDFVAFQAANSTIIDGTAYFWSQASPPDATNPGNEVSNFSQNDYATYVAGTGIGTAGGDPLLIPTQYIPSGQGFFVVGLDNADATFTNSMRVTGNNDLFFRVNNNSKSNSKANKLWINLTSDNGVFNQIAVGYVNGATNSNDGLMYDAPRNLSSGAVSILYTNIENSNRKFVIQGKAINSLNEDEVIKVGFKTAIDVPTIYTLSIAQLEGDFLNGNPIYLKDNLLNTLHNLKDSDYNFTSTVGEFNDRFEIVFNQEALSLGDEEINNNDLSIVELQNGNVQFKLSGNLAMSSIQIIDLQGRILYNLNADRNSQIYNLSNLSIAPYLAKVTLSNGAIITKKAVKRF
jgi:hypothetical protein